MGSLDLYNSFEYIFVIYQIVYDIFYILFYIILVSIVILVSLRRLNRDLFNKYIYLTFIRNSINSFLRNIYTSVIWLVKIKSKPKWTPISSRNIYNSKVKINK